MLPSLYRVEQKTFPLIEKSRHLAASTSGLPMHSPPATQGNSSTTKRNLALFILLNPVCVEPTLSAVRSDACKETKSKYRRRH